MYLADGEESETQSWLTEGLQGIIETLFDQLQDRPRIISGQIEDQYVGGSNPVSFVQTEQGVLILQNILNPFVLFLATLGVLIAAIRLLWQRRLDPMMDMLRGLLTVIVVTFAGIFLVPLLVGLGQALTDLIIDQSRYRQSGGSYRNVFYAAKEVYPSILRVGILEEDSFVTTAAREAIGYIIGTAVILGLIAQIIVLNLSEAIIYLIACILPLAAASTMIPNMRIFSKVVGWLIACILYKPLIILIYLAGLIILAASDNDVFRYFLGATIMLLATGALPVLMKLMGNPTVWLMAGAAGGLGALGGGGSGGGGGGGGSGGPSSGSSSSGGNTPQGHGTQEHANDVERNLNDSSDPSSSSSDSGTGTGPGHGVEPDHDSENGESVEPSGAENDQAAGAENGEGGNFPRMVAAAGSTVPGAGMTLAGSSDTSSAGGGVATTTSTSSDVSGDSGVEASGAIETTEGMTAAPRHDDGPTGVLDAAATAPVNQPSNGPGPDGAQI